MLRHGSKLAAVGLLLLSSNAAAQWDARVHDKARGGLVLTYAPRPSIDGSGGMLRGHTAAPVPKL